MKVAVVQGGPSTEAEVSRASGRALVAALRTAGHTATQVELGPGLGTELLAMAPDVVFPVAHGNQGEDGCLQGLLEIAGLPYVGSGVLASALAADKIKAKVFLSDAGLDLAPQCILTAADLAALEGAPLAIGELLTSLRRQLGPEFIIKPSRGGSTIGISRLLADATPEDLHQAVSRASELDDVLLVESYVRGREITCSVLEEEAGPRALAITLVQAQASDWYDFQSKYAPGGSQHQTPAPLDPALTERVFGLAVAAHRALGARDLSRTDFIIDEAGRPIALEVNTLPGMTEVSLFPEAAAVVGLSFPQLADYLVRRASHRAGPRLTTAPTLPT